MFLQKCDIRKHQCKDFHSVQARTPEPTNKLFIVFTLLAVLLLILVSYVIYRYSFVRQHPEQPESSVGYDNNGIYIQHPSPLPQPSHNESIRNPQLIDFNHEQHCNVYESLEINRKSPCKPHTERILLKSETDLSVTETNEDAYSDDESITHCQSQNLIWILGFERFSQVRHITRRQEKNYHLKLESNRYHDKMFIICYYLN